MVTMIRLARVKTGLTLRGFAREYSFPETALCRIELGQAYVPEKWRVRLAGALNVPLDELCDDRGWPRYTE